MVLYLVTADTIGEDDENYGASISCFGVATNEESLKSIESEVRFRGFEPKVTQVQAEILIDAYLGGYVE